MKPAKLRPNSIDIVIIVASDDDSGAILHGQYSGSIMPMKNERRRSAHNQYGQLNGFLAPGGHALQLLALYAVACSQFTKLGKDCRKVYKQVSCYVEGSGLPQQDKGIVLKVQKFSSRSKIDNHLSIAHPSIALQSSNFLKITIDLFDDVRAAQQLIAQVRQYGRFLFARQLSETTLG